MLYTRTLKYRDSGKDVKEWQTFLNIKSVGIFDKVTLSATKKFQSENGLVPDGIVGPKTQSKAEEILLGNQTLKYKFIECKNYTRCQRTEVKWIVIHSMEAPEKEQTALAVASWGAGANAPQASWHYAIDANEIIQCVPEECVAWHAPGANKLGIGLEHAGYAKQIRDEWLDEYSKKMLILSAKLCAEICKRWNIPAEYVDADGLVAGKSGITTHRAVTYAFKKGTHLDPGKFFPMDWYLEKVKENL